jgi:hypothetical protein
VMKTMDIHSKWRGPFLCFCSKYCHSRLWRAVSLGLRSRLLHRFPFHLSGLQFGMGYEKMPDQGLKGFGMGRNRRGIHNRN